MAKAGHNVNWPALRSHRLAPSRAYAPQRCTNKLPLSIEANQGQVDSCVRFLVQGTRTCFFSQQAIRFSGYLGYVARLDTRFATRLLSFPDSYVFPPSILLLL
jgi:hypothetical protein